MRRLLAAVAIVLALAAVPHPGATEVAPPSFLALSYHDVADSEPDQAFVGIRTSRLVTQLSWLQMNGYVPVTVDQLLAARGGGPPLPDKAVLLTFDDGYVSFYTHVLPILKVFRFPAVLALVGAWMEGGPERQLTYPADLTRPSAPALGGVKGAAVEYGEVRPGTVQFGDLTVRRDRFLTWDQVREIKATGLVEIASHSYAAHRGTLANPQGNSEPAVTTLRFDPATGRYQGDEDKQRELAADSERMAQTIERETGTRPRVMVWPYGEHSERAVSIAAAAGMPLTFTLKDGFSTLDRLSAVPRHLINPDPSIGQFVSELRHLDAPNPVRVVHVDLDYVHDTDLAQQARNLDALIERIHAMQISTVYLQAFADPDGSGLVREVYFPNRVLPMRADLFNRVSWQLRSRARVQVFAWMPVLAFDFPDVAATTAWTPRTGGVAPDPDAYRRVSLFDPEARRRILTLYEDLARHAPFDGLLFHDDAQLSDFEDASPPALAAYARAGLPGTIAALRADPVTWQRWTRFKTDALIAFTAELTAQARVHRAPLLTARSLYAGPVLDPASEAWFAQDLDRFLATYDQTAIMAMPAMENVPARESEAWLRRLVAAVAARPEGLRRTVFELQAVDWSREPGGAHTKIPTETLGAQMRLLLRLGALNYGYYPDDFVTGHPDRHRLHRDFSLQSFPYLE